MSITISNLLEKFSENEIVEMFKEELCGGCRLKGKVISGQDDFSPACITCDECELVEDENELMMSEYSKECWIGEGFIYE